ncbi:hypothetical protein BCR37DRAFT_393049 [Protomyces lactucae-debilis]|uniref:Uncharacterized protein n=1 Tax=Protomyces lactucae-debilis TaxID=2754530 RepID=A0A1Y2FGR7_PROLT|nr:uncharacterized protein BCR37DRAFT_393049 [Protomyces lactucae-debilis]ORY82005.1 hypothetical protein BCR37DRAFT_393049 [Protomyces lactucae-debilis]
MLQLYPNAFEFEEYFFAKGPYIHSPQNYAVFCWNVDLDIGSLPTQGDPLGHSCFWTRSAESIPLTEPDSWLLKCTPHPRQLNMLALPPDNLGNWKAVPARPQACFLYLAGPVDKPYLTIQCIESYNVELHDLPAFKSYLPDSQTTGGHCRLILKSDADDAFPELNLPDTWFTAVNRISRSLDQFGVYCERNDIKYDTRYILPRITPLGHKCYWVLGTGDKSLIFAQCEDAEDWRYQ